MVTSNRTELPRVCVIGAGCSGISVAKALKDQNIPFDVYEKGSDIGCGAFKMTTA